MLENPLSYYASLGLFFKAIYNYSHVFMNSSFSASSYWQEREFKKWLENNSGSPEDYLSLLNMNMHVADRAFCGGVRAMTRLMETMLVDLLQTAEETGGDLRPFIARQLRMLERLAEEYPGKIEEAGEFFGLGLSRGQNIKIAETDRFTLWQITPTSPTETKMDSKPILIIPPYVLGADILSFLPAENKSYVHAFANQGIPTYIRIIKSIKENPAVQVMTGEDDVMDTQYLCRLIMDRHSGRKITLNGYCQGGYMALLNILSGKLEGLVDTLITCVAPIDGTRSKGLADFLKGLPRRFNDLDYGTKTLPNGQEVASGDLMSWVYRLKAIETEGPMSALMTDALMLRPDRNKGEVKLGLTVHALQYWLRKQRVDLPLEITKLSFASFNIPITPEGEMPVELFGEKLNIKKVEELGIKWLICYGERDDLVEKECALAPLDYVEAEVTAFPKGHVAIATSWSHPESECALHKCFGKNGQYRGPVRFHLDISEKQEN